jgi:Ca2+-binding RTX toxin-like protein
MRRSRRFLATLVISSVVVAYVGVAVLPASATGPDQSTSDVEAGITSLASVIGQLSGVGQLGQTIPTLSLAPGGPSGIGLDTLLGQTLSGPLAGNFGGATDLDGLVAKLNGVTGTTLPDGTSRQVSIVASHNSAGGVDTIPLTLSVTRTVDAGLAVSSTSPQFQFSSSGGVSVQLTAALHVDLNYRASDRFFSLTHSATTPSLTLDAHATVPAPSAVQAAIGILGVTLGTGSAFTLDAHLAGSFNDPNNDGHLAFTEADGSAGELAAADAGPGLFSAGWAPSPGSMTATLNIMAQPSALIASLPAASATVTVAMPDLSTGQPVVSLDTPLAPLQAFERLGPRDLADALGQLASALSALQMTHPSSGPAVNIDLPFMKGTLADAVAANEAIRTFLSLHVGHVPGASDFVNGVDDPKNAGKPDFASIQGMLQALNDEATTHLPGGANIGVSGAAYNGTPGQEKLSFTLTIERTSAADQALDPIGSSLTGSGAGVTYTDTTLIDSSRTFDPLMAGRKVSAGAFTGAILSAAGHVLTLDPAPFGASPPTSLWAGASPAQSHPTNGAAYSIAAADPQVGLVQFANALKGGPTDGTGLINVNASIPVARVTPTYRAVLPMVLDLRPPTTPGPVTVHNPDGTDTIADSLPTPGQRIMIHTGSPTPLLVADAAITSAVDAKASVGFLGVNVTGSLSMTSGGTGGSTCAGATTHLLSVCLLTPPDADTDGDLTLPKLFADLRDHTTETITAQIKGSAHAALSITVPGTDKFFGGGSTASVTVDLPDITDPSTASVTGAGPDFGKLKSFDLFNGTDPLDPTALFNALLNVLGPLDTRLGALSTSGPLHDALATKIPVLGKSVQALVAAGPQSTGQDVTYGTNTLTDPHADFTGMEGHTVTAGTVSGIVATVSGQTLTLVHDWSAQPPPGTSYQLDTDLHAAIAWLQANPVDNLQDLDAVLSDKLGHGSGLTFSVDSSTTPPTLHLDMDWKRDYHLSAPVQFDIGSTSLVGTQGHGSINVGVTGEVKANLRFPLSAAAIGAPLSNLKIGAGSGITVKATADAGNDTYITANAGPLAIALGDPSHPTATGVQMHADLGVGLKGSGGADQTLDGFVSGLTVGLNQGVAPVTCSNAPSSSTDLAVCAALPIYVSTNGTDWKLLDDPNTDLTASSVLVRIPQQTGTDLTALAAQLDPTGTYDGATDRVVPPADFASKLANAVLDLKALDDGLLGYLSFAQNAMNLASANGTLPIVGKDLQEGSDFVGKIRTSIDTALGSAGMPNGKLPTAGDIKTKLDALKTQLTAGSLLDGSPGAFTVGLECANTTLGSPDAPTVNKIGSGTGTSYLYKIAAVRSSDGTGAGVPSAPSAAVDNAATLDGTNHNSLTWNAVDNADHYDVLVSTDGGATYRLVEQVTGTTYDDQGHPRSAYTAAATAPALATCPDSLPGDQVTGVKLTMSLGQGDVNNPASCATCSVGTPLDLGLPGLSLKAVGDPNDPANQVKGSLAWRIRISVVLDKAHGFYVPTQENDGSGQSHPELGIGLSLDAPASLQAQLAFINVELKKHAGVTAPLFKGAFTIDLKTPTGTVCPLAGCAPDTTQRLDLAALKDAQSIGDLVHPTLSADANIDEDLKATASSALPGIGAEFKLVWHWASDDPTSGTLSVLQFNNVTIDPGTFLGSVLGPIFKQVADLLKPIKPVLDTIQAPIPVLSDLSKAVGGDDVTIASLAQTFSTLASGPDIAPFLDVITKVVKLAGALNASCGGGGTFCITVGSFDLNPQTAKTEQNNPDLATQPGFITAHESTTSPLAQLDDTVKDSGGHPGLLTSSGHDTAHPGFEFPALQHPTQIFQLLMGHDVTLATFDSGPLTLGFSFSQEFGPVYAPPPVLITISGSASVTARVKAGFDTYGIRKAVESGKVDTGILDSLYLATVDDTGKPLPVITLTGTLAAGAEVSVVLLKAGVEGGVTLTVSFYWHDPDNDGKFRFSEFLASAMKNPICLFDVGGQLSVFLKVFITVGFSPFDVSFDFTLVNVKLLDFSLQPNCTPPPPRLGGVHGTTLYIYAGALGTGADRGDSAWDAANAKESWVIRQKPAGGSISVQGLGITHVFTQPITTVVFDGRGYGGDLSVLFQGAAKDTPFTLTTVVFGGNGADTIRTGSGESYVDGGPGNDQISTGDRPDPGAVSAAAAPKAVVAGGAGDDVITTGNAQDWVAGDGALTYSTASGVTTDGYDSTGAEDLNASTGPVPLPTTIDPSTVGHPADGGAGTGDDLITVGMGGSEIWGGGGNDKIGTAQAADSLAAANGANPNYVPGPNTIVGGTGDDTIASGPASDVIYTGDKTVIGPDDYGNTDGTNTVDTGSGNDTVYGAAGVDNVTVHSKPGEHATVYGGGGNDILDGGDGTDALYGGPGNDYLIAQPATVDQATLVTDQLGTAFTVQLLADSNPPASKTLVGGGGSDRIYGGDGGSTIYGDHQVDPCVSPGPAASDPPAEHPVTSPADQADQADLITGGNGVDQIQAGGGGDFVTAKGGNDIICGAGGNDQIDAGAGNDTVWAGTGNDTVLGQSGNDSLYGNTGNDTVYGNDDADVIEGNNGSDTLFGGAGDDTVVGGTELAGRPDQGDTLYGDTGADLLIGDNGAPTSGGAGVPFDLGAANPALGGSDAIFGGDASDHAYGGLADDAIHGGSQADYIEGNNGSDTIAGDAGADDIIGGSSTVPTGDATVKNVTGYPDSGDIINGGGDDDVIAGDNAVIATTGTPAEADPVLQGRGLSHGRHVTLLDLGDAPMPGTSGNDIIGGGDGTDAIYGQGGNDRISGNAGDDYAEGGPGDDWIEGNAGDDDLVGGSSTLDQGSGDTAQGQPDTSDAIWGGPGDDLITGDNAVVTRAVPFSPYVFRVGSGGGLEAQRGLQLLDLKWGSDFLTDPTRPVFGADQLSGGPGVDVVFGQDGNDQISGGAGDDYLEGNGGADTIFGDRTLAEAGLAITPPFPSWPTGPVDTGDASSPNGQDDLIGGSSQAGFRDGADALHGDAGADFLLGDNGTAVRDIVDNNGHPVASLSDVAGAALPLVDRIYSKAYDPAATPTWAAYVRHGANGASTRFCSTDQSTCEPVGAFGADTLWGDAGPDTMYGQDGNDTMYGNDGTTGGQPDGALADPTQADDDSMYGELGNDTMFGEGGDDAMLGDRGGIVDQWESGSRAFTINLNAPPAIHYDGYVAGSVTRQVDLQHDVNGDAFAGSATSTPMPHPGDVEGGDDRIRGGAGNDSLHAGYGDDLVNGDSGGDAVYGDDGADVLWGGKGCDATIDTPTGSPDCYPAGTFDPNARGTGDRMVDYLFGGKGATTGPSVDPTSGNLGSDVLDWRPRGAYTPGTGCTTAPWPVTTGKGNTATSVDPCSWFEMTNLTTADDTDNQHHQGIDWQYGGWDRDILQADVADNGPNQGDRLLDWTGSYNLYTHCNAAYGGFNDVRQFSPALQDFLQRWASSTGAGQAPGDVTTSGTSAYDELALVYTGDINGHGAGSAFPSTPGHFDNPNACAP